MFAMLRQFFAMFANLFEAGAKLSNAANHAASFVEGEAAGFNERTSLERVQQLKKMRSAYSIEDHKLAAEEALSLKNLDVKLRETANSPTANAA